MSDRKETITRLSAIKRIVNRDAAAKAGMRGIHNVD